MSDRTGSAGGPSPFVAGAVGVVVGASIVAAGIWFGVLAAGDEAPIRVKHGSMDFELAYRGKKWKEDGDKKRWKMASGTRNSDGYALYITVSNSASCPGGLNPTGDRIRFQYSEGTATTSVELKSQNKKTKLVSDKDLETSADGMTISYKSGSGYISLVNVDGTDVCKFTEKDSKLNIVLL